MIINSELIKQSIVSKLLEISPNTSVYKEAIKQPNFPHFFIYQISVSDELERNKYHLLDYSMEIRYRTASDSSTDLRLEKNLDEMALKLLQNFNVIDCGESKIRCTNKSIEKQEGVLHFLCHFVVLCTEIDESEFVKFDKLELEVNAR